MTRARIQYIREQHATAEKSIEIARELCFSREVITREHYYVIVDTALIVQSKIELELATYGVTT